MNAKTIVFDIDGVLADFIKGALDVARDLDYDTPHITTMEHQHWDIYPGLDDRGVNTLWEFIAQHSSFWSQLTPLATQAELQEIERLIYCGHRVYFATNRKTHGALEATREWLDYYIGRPSNIIITHRKGEFCKVVDADYYIDDKSENIDCALWMTDKKTRAYVITRPYNSGIYAPHSQSARRVATLREFLEAVNAGI